MRDKRRIGSLLALLAASLVVAACGADPTEHRDTAADAPPSAAVPNPADPPARPRIVALGDSLTAGYGLPKSESYPAILQQRIDAKGYGFEVVNAGASGDTSAGGLRRLDWALDGDVRILIVALGANDGLRGLPVDEMQKNLTEIVRRARARNIEVILAGMEAPPNYGPEDASQFRQAYRDIAAREPVVFVPFLLDEVAGVSGLNQSDGIHPNTEGTRIVAETIWTVLQPLLDRMAGGFMIELHGVSKTVPSGGGTLTILHSTDLTIPAGRVTAITGPSGSGKSTLLGLIAGLDAPTAGRIVVDGVDITALDEDGLARLRGARIGFVFQFFHLLPSLTAFENVLVPMEIAGLRDAAPRARALLEEVGLTARGHHYPSQLSGGEQQRVAIARALANDPPILLADEPTGNLDSATGRAIVDLLLGINKARGTTLVFVTHDPELANVADLSIALRDGRVVRVAEPVGR